MTVSPTARYATPCDEYICWYDSTWNLVPALHEAAVEDRDRDQDQDQLVSLQTIPETGLAPCSTDSNVSCPWYLLLDVGNACNVQHSNNTKEYALAASWCVVQVRPGTQGRDTSSCACHLTAVPVLRPGPRSPG